MPFFIAGFAYVFFAAPTLAIVGGLYLAKRKPPVWATLGGVLGSLAGFLLGCVVAALVCMTVPRVGLIAGATAVVVSASLGAALMGTAAGVAIAKRVRCPVG